MLLRATPFVTRENAMRVFDILEEPAYDVLRKYLEEHGWDDEARRLRESRFVGVGAYRLLTNLSVEHLDGSPESLIAFYERCKRPKDDPHYEDLITTILLSVVLNILSNYFYDAIKMRTPDLHEPGRLARRLWESFGGALEYLFRARWLRGKLWRREVTREAHDALLSSLRVKYLLREKRTSAEGDSEILFEAEVEFESEAKRHGLDLRDMEGSLMTALVELSPRADELALLLEEFRRLVKEEGGRPEEKGGARDDG
jgi:hypothetical protein